MITLLIISLFAALIASVTRKHYADVTSGNELGNFIFSGVCSFVATIVLLIWGGIGSFSTFTLILGGIFGVVTTIQFISMQKALAIGPLSYTQVIVSFSTIIPALSGVLFFNEKIVALQIVGIAFTFISLYLSVGKNKEEKKSSLKWLAFCLIAFLGTGMIGVMQKIHQSSNYASELNAFLIVAFLVSFILSIAVALFYKKQFKPCNREQKNDKIIVKLLIITCLSGISIAVNNKLNLYLSGVMPSAVFFPVVNGGGLVLTTLCSLVLFKEKLNLKQWIGIVFGIVSVVLLCNPF